MISDFPSHSAVLVKGILIKETCAVTRLQPCVHLAKLRSLLWRRHECTKLWQPAHNPSQLSPETQHKRNTAEVASLLQAWFLCVSAGEGAMAHPAMLCRKNELNLRLIVSSGEKQIKTNKPTPTPPISIAGVHSKGCFKHV